MPMTHIALLRAVNVGGHNQVAMGDLRALAAGLGLTEPRSLLQSGNLVFGAGRTPAARLEELLEDSTAKRLGVQTDFYVRTADEWKSIIANNPFPAEARNDPGHLLVMFFKRVPTPAAVKVLQRAITGCEIIRPLGRELYVTYPDGVGKSRLTVALMAKILGQDGTGRNWNTVLKLGALAGAGMAPAGFRAPA